MNIEEKVTYGLNYTLSLPSFPDEDEFSRKCAVFYDRLRERAAAFAGEDTQRIRSYKSSYRVTSGESFVSIEVILTARIKERGKATESRTKVICDKWSECVLVTHSCTEK